MSFFVLDTHMHGLIRALDQKQGESLRVRRCG